MVVSTTMKKQCAIFVKKCRKTYRCRKTSQENTVDFLTKNGAKYESHTKRFDRRKINLSRKICPIKVKSSADNKLTRSARKPDRIRHAFYLQSADQEDNLIIAPPYMAPERIKGRKKCSRTGSMRRKLIRKKQSEGRRERKQKKSDCDKRI